MFTATDDENHLASQYHLLPFVAAILGEGSIPRKGRYLPVGDPSALTQYSVEAMDNICRRAPLAFLCKMGWPELDYIAVDGSKRTGRIWQKMAEGSKALSYSDACIDILLTTYNFSRLSNRAQPIQPVPATLPPFDEHVRSGDQLVHHIVMLRLSSLVSNFNQQTLDFFGPNPLNAMARFDQFDGFENLDALFNGPIASWLPWLGQYWSRLWLSQEPLRWAEGHASGWAEGHEFFHSFGERQHRIFSDWIAQCDRSERLELLRPLISYYAQLTEAGVRDWQAQIEDLAEGYPRQEYQRIAQSHSDSLEPAMHIGRLYNQARGVHPVEREPAQQLFMESFTEHNFEQTIDTIKSYREKLLPSIG